MRNLLSFSDILGSFTRAKSNQSFVGQENDGGSRSVGLADATLHQDSPEEEEHGESEELLSLASMR